MILGFYREKQVFFHKIISILILIYNNVKCALYDKNYFLYKSYKWNRPAGLSMLEWRHQLLCSKCPPALQPSYSHSHRTPPIPLTIKSCSFTFNITSPLSSYSFILKCVESAFKLYNSRMITLIELLPSYDHK